MRLRSLRNFVEDWIIPPAFLRAGRKLGSREWTFTSREATLLARNAKFHNMYFGRRCFVIGNGPSSNNEDLTQLSGEITITMNWFR